MTISIIDRAAIFSREKHAGQKYGDEDFFEGHVQRVVDIVSEYTGDPEIVAAAYLHDTVEDTDTTLDEIEAEFGSDVRNIIFLVTDPKIEGLSRKEIKQHLYHQFTAGRGILRRKAAVVKCADRIANHRKSLSTINLSKMRMYLSEFGDFLAAFGSMIATEKEFKGLWDALIAQHNMLHWKIETYR